MGFIVGGLAVLACLAFVGGIVYIYILAKEFEH